MPLAELPESAVKLTDAIAYSWVTCNEHDECLKDSNHLLHWHVCPKVDNAWDAGGMRLHTVVQVEPLTVTASVFCSDCCGLHGWITDGKWVAA